MDQDSPLFVLDTNVFIEAHHRYYAQEVCPGFWECLDHYSREKRVVSIDRVRNEILRPSPLVKWVSEAPSELFVTSADPPVIAVFKEMANWVQQNRQFRSEARTQFARVADGWIAAYARVNGAVVVTHERFRAGVRNRVPLPNVCREFGVEYRDTFGMLRELEARFDWRRPE